VVETGEEVIKEVMVEEEREEEEDVSEKVGSEKRMELDQESEEQKSQNQRTKQRIGIECEEVCWASRSEGDFKSVMRRNKRKVLLHKDGLREKGLSSEGFTI
jgi:hypothetical protein